MVNPMVVDLSHWDTPATDYAAVKKAGIVGVIYKATEATGYTDPTYVKQQAAAKAAGLLWGSYHFADASDVNQQAANYLRFASPDPEELFCLDWEDNGGNTMSLANVQTWIDKVESALGRPGQCVLYSGNTAKEALGNTINTFLGSRRLWLCQYGSSPVWQRSWNNYWLWQYTDGQLGPMPHSIPGIGPCDINSYDHAKEQLIAEWATGQAAPVPPITHAVDVVITSPPGVTVNVRQVTEMS